MASSHVAFTTLVNSPIYVFTMLESRYKLKFIFFIPKIIFACQNIPHASFTRKFQLETHIRDGYLNHLNAGDVEGCNFHKQIFGNRHNRNHHKKTRIIKHKPPAFDERRKRGTKKIHKKTSKEEAWWKHLTLYRKDVEKESLDFLKDYDNRITIFKIGDHMNEYN